jgi:hypothetical protein
MSRTFFVKLNLDDMCAELDTLRPDQHAEWLAGFRAGARGKVPDGWDGARLAGAEFGHACFLDAEAFRGRQSEKGKRSAEARAAAHGSADPRANCEPDVNHGSTVVRTEREVTSIQYPVSNTPESKNEKPSKTGSASPPEDGFLEFWGAYDYKKGKPNAMRAWKRLSQSDREAAIAGIAPYKASVSDPQYTKHPATYLNGRAWEDDHTKRGGGPAPILDWNGKPCPFLPGTMAYMDWMATHAPIEYFK